MPTPKPERGSSTWGAKELRANVGAVFVSALPQGSAARDIAERAAVAGTAYVRGKDAFAKAAAALRALPGCAAGDDIGVRRPDGTPTQAGQIIEQWKAASVMRESLFDEVGAKGRTVLVVDIRGIDLGQLWKDDEHGSPCVVKGASDASLVLFETAPSLDPNKQPDADNGVLQTLQGSAVSVKRRGNTSRWDPKPNLCVLLDDDEASGFPKQLNLTNCIRDPSYQRIRLAWSLFAKARSPVQPNAYAELRLNGAYQGTYVALAPVDHHYFCHWFPSANQRAIFRGQYGDDISGGATLEPRGSQGQDYFSASYPAGARTYEPRLHTKDKDYDALASFVTTLHRSGDPQRPAFAKALEAVFDVETFLRTIAVINLLGSWDAYYLNAQNYFLHIDSDAAPGGRLRVGFCPYDQDSVLGVSWPGQKRDWQDKDVLFRGTEIGKIPLITLLLQNLRFRAYYLDFMSWFVTNHFTHQHLADHKASLWQTLEKSVYLESNTPWGTPFTKRPWTNDQVYQHAVQDRELDANSGAVAGLQVPGILAFVDARRAKVLAQLAGETHGGSAVDFDSDNWKLR